MHEDESKDHAKRPLQKDPEGSVKLRRMEKLATKSSQALDTSAPVPSSNSSSSSDTESEHPSPSSAKPGVAARNLNTGGGPGVAGGSVLHDPSPPSSPSASARSSSPEADLQQVGDSGNTQHIPTPPNNPSKAEDVPGIPTPPNSPSNDGDVPHIPTPPSSPSSQGDEPDIPTPPSSPSNQGDLPDIPMAPTAMIRSSNAEEGGGGSSPHVPTPHSSPSMRSSDAENGNAPHIPTPPGSPSMNSSVTGGGSTPHIPTPPSSLSMRSFSPEADVQHVVPASTPHIEAPPESPSMRSSSADSDNEQVLEDIMPSSQPAALDTRTEEPPATRSPSGSPCSSSSSSNSSEEVGEIEAPSQARTVHMTSVLVQPLHVQHGLYMYKAVHLQAGAGTLPEAVAETQADIGSDGDGDSWQLYITACMRAGVLTLNFNADLYNLGSTLCQWDNGYGICCYVSCRGQCVAQPMCECRWFLIYMHVVCIAAGLRQR